MGLNPLEIPALIIPMKPFNAFMSVLIVSALGFSGYNVYVAREAGITAEEAGARVKALIAPGPPQKQPQNMAAGQKQEEPPSNSAFAALYMTDVKQWPRLAPGQLAIMEEEASGNPRYAWLLAEIYRKGARVEKDLKKASALYDKAAEKGTFPVWFELGELYANGEMGDENRAKGIPWLEKAVNAPENTRGMGYYDYAFLLYQTDPVKYREEIIKWAGKSKIENNPRSEGLLAKMKNDDQPLAQAKAEAASAPAPKSPTFEEQTAASVHFDEDAKKAEAGDTGAQFRLGYAYFTGTGTPRSQDKGVALITKAADAGLPEAQYQLGLMYAGGQGVYQKDATAFALFQKSAAQGFAPAQFRLALAYTQARGTAKDEGQAQAWLEKARAQKYQPALDYGGPAEALAASQPLFGEGCRLLVRPGVSVTLEMEPDVRFDHSLSIKGLTVRETGGYSQDRLWDMDGLYSPEIGYSYDYGFSHAAATDGRGDCLGMAYVRLTIRHKPAIYIVSDFAEGSCKYEHVKAHELRHHKINAEFFPAYKPILEKYISELLYALPPVGPIEDSMVAGKKEDMRKIVRKQIESGVDTMLGELKARQITVDSPEEYNTGLSECNGRP
jgi:TPR repeat protein